ncbi:MAG: ligase-associated DNA damage response exonuclease [Casimicrobiaceae bacterium]
MSTLEAEVPLLTLSEAGLYCPLGDFHIDPWRSVARAVITHAHGDHARPGSAAYLGAAAGLPLLARRLGSDAAIETLAYGATRRIGSVDVSLHPAGHVLGSAQVRLAHRGRTWVVSGDYKLAPDPTCAPFEPVRCDVLITESTFGLPIYRWDSPARIVSGIARWWETNRAEGVASVLFAYALGKAQRILAGLAQHYGGSLPGPVYCHGAVERLNEAYRDAGVDLPSTRPVATAPPTTAWGEALVLAPPSARGTRWVQRFGPFDSGFASGWMAIRGTRRRASYDRGFALSDHADWDGLNAAIAAADPEEVWVTHGYRDELVRWLGDQGRRARAIATHFEGEAGAELPLGGSEMPA